MRTLDVCKVQAARWAIIHTGGLSSFSPFSGIYLLFWLGLKHFQHLNNWIVSQAIYLPPSNKPGEYIIGIRRRDQWLYKLATFFRRKILREASQNTYFFIHIFWLFFDIFSIFFVIDAEFVVPIILVEICCFQRDTSSQGSQEMVQISQQLSSALQLLNQERQTNSAAQEELRNQIRSFTSSTLMVHVLSGGGECYWFFFVFFYFYKIFSVGFDSKSSSLLSNVSFAQIFCHLFVFSIFFVNYYTIL